MDKTVDKLIKFVSKNFAFDGTKYPELKDADQQKRFRFGLKHVTLHMAVSLSKVAKSSERFDHGKDFDITEIRADAVNTIINGLKLAELLNISGEEIIKEMETKYHDKIENND